jgi:hypothetical protein
MIYLQIFKELDVITWEFHANWNIGHAVKLWRYAGIMDKWVSETWGDGIMANSIATRKIING